MRSSSDFEREHLAFRFFVRVFTARCYAERGIATGSCPSVRPSVRL